MGISQQRAAAMAHVRCLNCLRSIVYGVAVAARSRKAPTDPGSEARTSVPYLIAFSRSFVVSEVLDVHRRCWSYTTSVYTFHMRGLSDGSESFARRCTDDDQYSSTPRCLAPTLSAVKTTWRLVNLSESLQLPEPI